LKKNYLSFILILSCFTLLAGCGSLSRQREKFVVSLNSPQIPIGEIEAQFNAFLSFGSLKKDNLKTIYFPKEDAVCLQYRREFITYHQFWSYSGRQTLITALEQYNNDYTERNLNTQNRKTLRNYGAVEGYLYWQQFSFTVLAKANVNIDIGYQFKDNAPYFSVNQREAEFKEDTSSRDNNRTSSAVTLYFTRAQAAELAALFDQSFLQSLITAPIPGLTPEPEEVNNADRDVY